MGMSACALRGPPEQELQTVEKLSDTTEEPKSGPTREGNVLNH